MNSKKGFALTLIIVILAILGIGSVLFVTKNKKVEAPVVSTSTAATTSLIVGGDKDIHGCIGSAGYSWCAVKNKCLRPWEEKCIATSTSCIPKWTCGWGPCKNGYQGMTAVDSNNCGLSNAGVDVICPALARECVSQTGENSFCGGIAGIKCASGLTCKYDGTYPDAGGKCISEIK